MVHRLRRLRGLPILFIHGKRDSVISIRNAYRALELSQSEKTEFVEVERAHHMTNRVILGQRYDQYVLDFFKKWIP